MLSQICIQQQSFIPSFSLLRRKWSYYHIKDANAVKQLVSNTLKTEYKIKSSVFEDAEEEKVNIFTKYPIMENVEIKDLEKESEKIKKDSGLVIFYTETDDLESEFEQIIST